MHVGVVVGIHIKSLFRKLSLLCCAPCITIKDTVGVLLPKHIYHLRWYLGMRSIERRAKYCTLKEIWFLRTKHSGYKTTKRATIDKFRYMFDR